MDPITAFIVNLIITLVATAASSLISSMMNQDKKRVSGVRGTIQTGGDHPLSFIMGFYGTAGHLKYAGTWGADGETPNAYFSKVVSVSDLPVRGLAGFFVNGERVTLAETETGDLGRAVIEYRDDAGKDHLWVKFYDGNQTAADPLMRAKFGGDADRPYTAEMVGRGVSYFVATALQNRTLFANIPEYFAEINGIPLNDPRGDNAHDNPLVGIHTIMRGIRYDGKWVYGPQSVAAGSFRADNLEAQMDKCDAVVAGQKRFRFGLEVQVDQEPHAVIGELLKACEGRVAELGGVYKFLVGEPDAPVVAITDEDIVITEGQTYEPFPGLEATFNGITATYPEPDEAWESKEAPPRYRSDLEAIDDNRRLPFATDYKAVPYPVQVQALMRAAIEETRRFRKHTQTMPPEWWEYEPLDTYAWTSARNGYVNKLFLVTAMEDLPNSNQFIGGQEIDPTDYSWSSDYELPWSVSPLVIARPAPQPVSGPSVAPVPGELAYDAFWSPASVASDVDFVRVSHRVPGDEGNTYVVPVPKPDLLTGSARVPVSLTLSGADIEVQLEYIALSGRPMVASAWMPVTIADVRIGPDDLTDELRGTVEDVEGFLDEELPVIRGEIQAIETDLDALAGAPVFVYGTTYAVNDLVRYSGGIYKATAANSNALPTDVSKWVKVGDYTSVAGAVVGFTGRFEQVESKAEATASGLVQTTRDTRRISNALLAAAMLNAEQGQNQVLANTDQLAATASVSETVRTEVSRIDGNTTALAEQINVVQAQVANDVAQAISAVTTQVQSVDGRVTAESQRVDQLRAVVGNSGAEVLVKGEVVSGPGGPGSRYAIRLQTTSNGQVLGSGVFFVDIASDGSSTIGLQASKTVFYTSDGTPFALLTDAKKFRSANGAYEVDMVTGDVVMTRGEIKSADNKFLISPSLKRISIST